MDWLIDWLIAALHIASGAQHASSVALLLANGAQDCSDLSGHWAKDLAYREGVKQAFLNHGTWCWKKSGLQHNKTAAKNQKVDNKYSYFKCLPGFVLYPYYYYTNYKYRMPFGDDFYSWHEYDEPDFTNPETVMLFVSLLNTQISVFMKAVS